MSGPFSVNPSDEPGENPPVPPPSSDHPSPQFGQRPPPSDPSGNPSSNPPGAGTPNPGFVPGPPHAQPHGEGNEYGGFDFASEDEDHGKARWVMPAIIGVVSTFVAIGIVVSLIQANSTDPTSTAIDTVPTTEQNPAGDTTTSTVPTGGSNAEMVTETCRTTEGLVPRECTVIIPPDTPDAPMPAVILLHGFGTPGWEVRSAGLWNQAQKDRDFIVVTPEGTFESWNAGACCGLANATGVDDVSYLRGLVERVAERDDVNSDEIYMVGASNGGMMMWRYLCANDGLIKKAASQAGTPMTDCVPDTPIPTIQIHGTDDLVVPYTGETTLAGTLIGVTFPALEPTIKNRADDRGCDAPTSGEYSSNVATTSYTGCKDGADITLYTIDGGGHDWPQAKEFPATDVVLDFFGL